MKLHYEIIKSLNHLKRFKFFKNNLYVYKRMINVYFNKVFLKKSIPRNMVIQLSQRCNAKCYFCYADPSKDHKQNELNLEEIYRTIDYASKIGIVTITLSGGEPLIYKNFEQVIKYACKKELVPFTCTNGLNAEPEYLKSLKKAGLAALNFSVLGWGERHDRDVGVEGAFEKVKQGVTNALGAGLAVLISHVVTRKSIQNGDLKRIIDYFMLKGVSGISLLDPCLNSTDKSILLTENEYASLVELESKPWIFKDVKNYPGEKGCPAAKGDFYISAYGDVSPCPFIPISFGNIRENELGGIYDEMKRHSMFESSYCDCPAARSSDFIDKYILPVYMSGKIPLHYKNHSGCM